MKLGKFAAVGLMAVLSACSSTMRLSGRVTDQRTGEPIPVCGVESNKNYARTDAIGKYFLHVRRDWKTVRFMAPGYETLTANFESASSRYPVIDVQLKPKAGPEAPLKLEEAVHRVTDDLFTQVKNRRGPGDEPRVAAFVSDPVIDADTGEVTKVSRRIEELMQDEARRKSPQFNISEMDSQNIDTADYVISGIIPLERRGSEPDKLRHLSLSVVDRKTGEIVGHSDAWVGNANLDFELTPMYADSPMYIKDARVEALIATAKAAAGSLADKEYFNSLATNALLGEASRAYDQGNFLLALGLFAKAAERGDGRVMKTFSGLYQSFFKLKRTSEAGQAFASLAELGMRSGNLSVKFLFNVNATDFFGSPEVLEEYQIWLKQIAGNILASKMCVQIVGHASRSGSAELNQELSLRRADLVRARLQTEAPGVEKKTTAIGRGFTENIIGTGANDASDAIDRRVEFKMSECAA